MFKSAWNCVLFNSASVFCHDPSLSKIRRPCQYANDIQRSQPFRDCFRHGTCLASGCHGAAAPGAACWQVPGRVGRNHPRDDEFPWQCAKRGNWKSTRKWWFQYVSIGRSPTNSAFFVAMFDYQRGFEIISGHDDNMRFTALEVIAEIGWKSKLWMFRDVRTLQRTAGFTTDHETDAIYS